MRPTSLIERRAPHGKWSTWDFIAFDAAHRTDDEICKRCGLPVYVCRNESNEIQFGVREEGCAATAAVEKGTKARTNKKGESLMPAGTRLVPEPFSSKGAPLSTYREAYWKGVMKQREARLEERAEQIALVNGTGEADPAT